MYPQINQKNRTNLHFSKKQLSRNYYRKNKEVHYACFAVQINKTEE